MSEQNQNEKIEQAYQVEMLTEIPDLWNRIEAALPEQAPSETVCKVVKFRYVKRAALIAAGICILLMAPMLLSLSRNSMMSADAEYSAPADASAPEASQEEAAPIEEMEEESAAEEAPAMAEEAAEEPAMEKAAEETPAEGMPTEEMLTEATPTEDAATQGMNDSSLQKQAEANTEFGEDALYTKGVRIEVISQDTTEAGSDDGYCLFTVMITDDTSGMYTIGGVCDVYADEVLSKSLKAGSKHTVTIVNPQPASSSQLKLYILEETGGN